LKNIVLLLHDDVGQDARLQAALDLSRALSGHLTCVDAVQMPIIAGSWDGTTTTILLDEEIKRESRNKARMMPRLRAEAVSWSWVDVTGDLAGCLLSAAKTADLIVLNRSLDACPIPDMRHVATDVLKKSRALIVAVSDSCAGFNAAGHALVAWDGSDRAIATIQRGVPLLALANRVSITQVGDIDEEAIAADDAATYLSRHGIEAGVKHLAQLDGIADAICREAQRIHATYVMMGAYGHRPIQEAVFGGVTRTMLGTSAIPLVLGH
jgi:nucleotide-binding universal stress UspA family protein